MLILGGYLIFTFVLLVVQGAQVASNTVNPMLLLLATVDSVFGKAGGDAMAICLLFYFLMIPVALNICFARFLMVAAIDGRVSVWFAKLNKERVPTNALVMQIMVAGLFAALLYFLVPQIGLFGTPATFTSEVYNVLGASLLLVWSVSFMFPFIDLAALCARNRKAFRHLHVVPLPRPCCSMSQSWRRKPEPQPPSCLCFRQWVSCCWEYLSSISRAACLRLVAFTPGCGTAWAAVQATVGGSLDINLSSLGFHMPGGWVAYAALLTLIVGILSYFDVKASVWVMAPFAIAEVLALIILNTAITIKGGDVGHDLVHTSTPAGATLTGVAPGGTLGIGIAMVLGILAFVGFETAAVYGEEARHPHRTIPVAIFSLLLFLAGLYIWTSYSATIGKNNSRLTAQTGIDFHQPVSSRQQADKRIIELVTGRVLRRHLAKSTLSPESDQTRPGVSVARPAPPNWHMR